MVGRHLCRQRPGHGCNALTNKRIWHEGDVYPAIAFRIRPRAWSRLGAALLAVLIGVTIPALAARAASEPAPPLPDAAQEAVAGTQVRLVVSEFDPGGIDGVWGPRTQTAYRSWQSSRQLPPDGVSKPEELRLLGSQAEARVNRLEVDLGAHQLRIHGPDDAAVFASHISAGSGEWYAQCLDDKCERKGDLVRAETPTGHFQVNRKVLGWKESPLGWLLDPLYFVDGFAIHGSNWVPAEHASHGCVRVPALTARALYDLVRFGTPVEVHA